MLLTQRGPGCRLGFHGWLLLFKSGERPLSSVAGFIWLLKSRSNVGGAPMIKIHDKLRIIKVMKAINQNLPDI